MPGYSGLQKLLQSILPCLLPNAFRCSAQDSEWMMMMSTALIISRPIVQPRPCHEFTVERVKFGFPCPPDTASVDN